MAASLDFESYIPPQVNINGFIALYYSKNLAY